MTSKVDEVLGYEQARDELIEVVRRLEAGGTTLEESLALWERGEELAKVCRRWLEGRVRGWTRRWPRKRAKGTRTGPGTARSPSSHASCRPAPWQNSTGVCEADHDAPLLVEP